MRRSGQGILVAEFGRKEDERAGTPYGVYKISTAAKAVLPKLSRQGSSYCYDSPELLTATQAGSTSDLFRPNSYQQHDHEAERYPEGQLSQDNLPS